jgi:putative transposase
MARPARHANRSQILSPSRTFFVTTKTSVGRALLQSERNAMLFIDVLRSYAGARKFQLHHFVVMPDHTHLISVRSEMTIKRAMQFIKGGFSFSIKEGIRVFERGLAARTFGGTGRRSAELAAISGLHCAEPGGGGAGGFVGEGPYSFTDWAKRKAAGAKAR